MQDLMAQVTSSLLQFPEATVQAIEQDERTLNSPLCGKFYQGRNGLAWLARGPQLEVVNYVTGERRSAHRFSGVNEQPPTVRVVKEFSWQKRTGLLVGLEEAEGSVLCLYDLGISRVVKAVVLPGRVTAIEPITNDRGPSVSTWHLHQSLRWLFGVAAVATDVGHLLLVDLHLDDLSCSQNEIEALDLEVVTRIPAEVPQGRETAATERRHLCFQLQNPSGTAISTLCYISRSNQLVVGFSDGYLSLWNMKTLKREHHSQLEGGRIPVYAVTFQEPKNDPHNCCYLWAVQSTQESEGDVVSLHLLQLAFGDRKRLASGQVLYEGLEYCDERYSLDLMGGVFPLRGQTSNTKLLSCQTVEKFRNHVDREDSVNEVISPETSVSIFSWQVNTYGQRKPSAYLGVFDINRWYHAQMPDSLRPEEFLHDCPYFALWSLDTVISMTSPNLILDILVRERSLTQGVPLSYPPPEQFFHPSNYNFDGTCLLNSGAVHLTCTGFQKQTLRFLKKLGPSISEAIHDSYNRSLAAGLLSPRLVDVQPSSLSQVSACQGIKGEIHPSCLTGPLPSTLLKMLGEIGVCRWQNDRDPRLRERAVARNSMLDQYGKILPRVQRRLAVERAKPYHLPSSVFRDVARPKPFSTVTKQANAGNVHTRATYVSNVSSKIGEARVGNEQNTSFSQRDRQNSKERAEKRLVVARRLSYRWYGQINLNAGVFGLQGNESQLHFAFTSSPRATEPGGVTHALLDAELRDAFVGTLFTKRSQKHSRLPDLVVHPVPSCAEAQGGSWQSPCRASAPFMASSPLKSNRCGSVSQKSFSGASELNLLQTPLVVKRAKVSATSASGFPGFTPRSILRSSLRTTPLATPSASPGQSVTPRLRAKERRISFREENLNAEWTVGQNDRDPRLRERAVARNSMLDQYGKILPRVQRRLAVERAKPYHLPSSVFRDVARPKPFSTVTKQANAGNVHTRATYVSNVSSKIGEARVGNEQNTSFSQRDRQNSKERAEKRLVVARRLSYRWYGQINLNAGVFGLQGNESQLHFAFTSSPRATEPGGVTHALLDAELRDAFVGTLFTKRSQKHSRLPDLVVHPVPSCAEAQGGSWQSPCRASAPFMASSPLKSNRCGSVSQKSFSGASELNLLQTPLVVKRAKVSATSASGFPGFTPRSILRSSLRTTPLATPSASPGQSVTPRLRAKERRISFREENLNAEWTVGQNDRDPRLRERAVARNSMLDQYGKILPRVQRRLAVERAKPYHLPSSVFRDVARPKPFSTVTKQANAGNVHTRATYVSNVSSKIGEARVGNEQNTSFSQRDSPRATEPGGVTHALLDAELRDAFVGTLFTKRSQKRSRLPDLVVHPVPSCAEAQGGSWQSPCRASAPFMASSPLKSNRCGSVSQKSFSGASELNLLQTPLVVKRAKVSATSASGFPGFTPRSILRSSLRTTPLATPSASPGQSVTPRLRAKERRISFREENLNAEWTVGVTEGDKALPGASSEHRHGVVEDAWSESRDKTTPLTLSNPEDDRAEMEESSESIPGDGLEKMDASKDTSNFSARSDQTPLEYHDAKSPGDFEDDVIFIAAKPANSSPEESAGFQEPGKEEDSEVVEEKPFQMEQPDSSELRKEAGFVEESNAESLTLPEDGKLVVKAAAAATFGTASEGETNHQESKTSSASEEKAIRVAPNPQLSESPGADAEPGISILDSEDVVSTHSENRLEGKCVDLPKEHDLEAAEVEENVPQEETAVSNNLPKTEEMNVIEDSTVKAQTSEEAPETSPYSELPPSGNLQYSYATIEQQSACDLPDNKDSECDAAEGDGELFISQSNFTLVLEGEEGEGEMGDPTLVDGSQPAGTTTEEKPVNRLGNSESQDKHVTNSVSAVTSDQESQNIAESLPSVPEPIKAAIAENLLDVIKDTRSKEFASEVVEQSIHEPIGKKVTRFQKAKAPLTTVPEGVEDDSSIHQVAYVIPPRTRTRGQLSRSPSIALAGDQQLLKTDKPVLFGLSPRRSTRRTKEASETASLQTEENAQGEQMPVIPVTPRRGRKPKPPNLEKVESSHSDGQTLSVRTQSITVTPRRGLRRAKEAASELLEEANEETCLAEGSILASATPKRPRGGKSSAGDEGSGQTDPAHKIKPAVSPSRSARKLKSINLQLTENTVKDPEVQPSDQVLVPMPSKRGRRRKMSSSLVSENSDLDLSKSSLPQTEFKLPVTPRRSARKGARNLSADTESLSTQEDVRSGGNVEILDTPRRRARRVPRAKPGKTDAHEQTPAQPNEESATPRTTVRTGCRGRKRRSILEESRGEEAFPQGPGGSPLLLEDINPSGHDETSRTLTDRITRTRSRKTATHQKLSVEENESFLFSPSLTKLTKRFKAGKADHPVQLKDLDPDMSSQFVFSPPLLRSRTKNVSSISRIVKEPELPNTEEKDTKSTEPVGKQKLKRGRTAKSEMKKASNSAALSSFGSALVEKRKQE
ncbi:protein ELYS-like [Theristicus caerulescens]